MTAKDALARARDALANITPGEWTDIMYGVVYVKRDYEPQKAVVELPKKHQLNFMAAAPVLVADLGALAEAQQAEIARLTEQIERLTDQLTDAQAEAGGWQDSFPVDVQRFLLGDEGAFDHDDR